MRDEQGLAIAWKPGYNYQIQILESREAPIPAEVIIADTWDSSWQNIEVKHGTDKEDLAVPGDCRLSGTKYACICC